MELAEHPVEQVPQGLGMPFPQPSRLAQGSSAGDREDDRIRARGLRHRAGQAAYPSARPVSGRQIPHASMSGSANAIIASSRLRKPSSDLKRPHPPRCSIAGIPPRCGWIFHNSSFPTVSREKLA